MVSIEKLKYAEVILPLIGKLVMMHDVMINFFHMIESL